ncbi:MAG: response regulator [Lacunisphaera sp.]
MNRTSTILLVEDEPTSVFFFEHVVKKLGITNPVRIARDGREAVDYLTGAGEFVDRQKYPVPGLVLLDLKLPCYSGFEVLQQLRQHWETKRVVVLILSSSASDDDIAKAYSLGATGYLVKPLHLEELQEIVRAIKDFWLTHNHSPPLSVG